MPRGGGALGHCHTLIDGYKAARCVIDAIRQDSAQPLRLHEPLVPAALAFVVGILLAEYLGGGMLVWCAAAVVAAGVWAVLYFRRTGDRWLMIALMVVVAAAGAARYQSTVDPAPDDVGRLVVGGPRLVWLEGTIARSVRQSSPPGDVFLPTTPYYTRCSLAVDSERVRIGETWYPATGRVQAVVRKPLADAPGPVPTLGDRVQVVGMLLPMGQPANPGSFDIAGYQRSQGVRAYVRTNNWESVRLVQASANPLLSAVAAMQQWSLDRLDAVPSAEGRAIAAAMLFGRKELLDFDEGQVGGEDLEHAFLATGTVHYMAVSGFNVALVVSPILILLRLLGAGRRTMAAVVATAVLLFALMTELEPPVLRASILFWVICLGWLVGREALHLNTLAAAVITVLLVHPGDLFSMSFQLSFLAVLGMLFVVRRLENDGLRGLRERQALAGWRGGGLVYRKFVRGMLLISVAATLVTAPLIASRFHVLAWTAPLASAALLPLVFVLTVAGMLLVCFGWIAPPVAAVLAVPVDALGHAIAATVKGLAAIPCSYFYVGSLTTVWVLAAYALLVLWVWRERLGVSGRRVALVVLTAAAAFTWTTGHRAPESLRATFLAVGSGHASVLELPNGRTVLYDAGSSLSFVRAAETVIAPALWSRGIDRVDAAIISHPHFDHFKDILPLVDRFGIRQVFIPPTFMRRRLSIDNALVEALAARGVEVQYLSAGDHLAGTGAVDVRGVWPQGAASQGKAINEGSLVLDISAPGRPGGPCGRLLLTGDLMPATDEALLAAEPDLRADAMLWPHHGHEPAAVGRLAQRVGAKVLVISSSRPFNPPPKPEWLQGAGIACYHTGEVGAITLSLLPEGPKVETFMPAPIAAGEEEEPAPVTGEGADN